MDVGAIRASMRAMNRLRLVLRQLKRIPAAARRSRELTASRREALALLTILIAGLLETHIPRLRRDALHKVRLGRGINRRTLYLRANGSDAFTFFEVFIREAYRACLPIGPGQVVIDLGANIGVTTAYFRLEGGPELRVIAVEPEAENHALLKRNAPESEVVVVRAAVTDESGPVQLRIGLPTGHGLASAGETGPTQMVHGLTLDELAASQGLEHVVALKVDIEGAESRVFVKPWNILRHTERIAMEMHSVDAERPITIALRAQGFDHHPSRDAVLPEVYLAHAG
jgi:FkbM family methyltransferase